MSLVKKLKTVQHPIPWAGPCGEGLNGGVTQSMLGRYLCCKERFRILVIEGLRPHPRFNAPMDFGTMWHSCEEALASGRGHLAALEKCVNDMLGQYPRDVEQILHWCSVAQELFPVYIEYWESHPDMVNRTHLLAEQPFDVPYILPSGRTVRLRGKWDAVDLVEDTQNAGIWLQEDKTKSSIDRAKITRQLTFDLQTGLYLIALDSYQNVYNFKVLGMVPHTIRGVRYNVVRRSAHKSTASMLKKVYEDVGEGRSNEWFDRFNVHVSPQDTKKFKQECLDPVLENLCDDFEWWVWMKESGQSVFSDKDQGSEDTYCLRSRQFDKHCPRHFRMPYGIYNPMTEGGFGDVDAYLEDGSEVGLERVANLFPELQDIKES